MELFSIICCQGACRIVIAEGLTVDELTELVATLNRCKTQGTHYLRARTPRTRVIELLTNGKVEVDW